MNIELSEEDRKGIEIIYRQLKKMSGSVTDLGAIEVLLKEAIDIATKYGKRGNPLLDDLEQTASEQLVKAKELPARDRGKWQAVANLKLHLTGDLLGWFDQ